MWNNTAVASYRVEVREWSLPGPGLVYPGTLYGTAVTDAAGRFVVTGLPVKGNLGVHLAEQSGYTFVAYGTHTTCGDRILELGDHPIRRAIAGLSVPQGGVVSSGPLTITWSAVPAATLYCVQLWNTTDQIPITSGTCDEGLMSPATRVVTPRFSTPALLSGKSYSLRVAGIAGTLFVAELSQGNVNFTVR